VPRRLPLTQSEVRERELRGFGPTRAKPVAGPDCNCEHAKGECPDPPSVTGKNRQQTADSRHFDEALKILGVVKSEDRIRCDQEISVICQLHELIQFVEGQETHARKAAAYQRARRWYKHHERATQLFDKAEKLEKSGKKNDAKPLYEKGHALRQSVPALPQALEQAASRRQAHGLSWDESLGELRSFHEQHSRSGLKPSDALRFTVHALQAFAASNGLSWTQGRVPPELIDFIAAVLKAADIKNCDMELIENRSRFFALLAKPTKKPTRMDSEPISIENCPETDLERRLSKVVL
jgi:hypothetical protein